MTPELKLKIAAVFRPRSLTAGYAKVAGPK
jgi:hypothetical protein